MGSPFVSTPVPYVVTPADWLAASIAQRNASILMQHAHLLQTMAQQARPGQIGYMPAPSALVNAMGSPFISTPAVMPVNAAAFHALQLMPSSCAPFMQQTALHCKQHSTAHKQQQRQQKRTLLNHNSNGDSHSKQEVAPQSAKPTAQTPHRSHPK
jgi:hypothetical protein